ncbi:MAG: cytochrome c [Bryobacterales bacterium]|nr:cytochrome c [Bryobacterales bacterium]
MSKLNLGLAIALLATLGAHLTVSRDPSRPNLEYLPEMVHSVAYDAYAPNPNFPDGATLQAPARGTLARGFQPLRYAATPEDALRAGRELVSPLGAKADARRGAFLFQTFCLPCHGATGGGDGLVAQRGYPAPPSLLNGAPVEKKDGQLFHVLTYGQNNMPSYAVQLTPLDRWEVIAHVRALQQAAAGAGGSKRGAQP